MHFNKPVLSKEEYRYFVSIQTAPNLQTSSCNLKVSRTLKLDSIICRGQYSCTLFLQFFIWVWERLCYINKTMLREKKLFKIWQNKDSKTCHLNYSHLSTGVFLFALRTSIIWSRRWHDYEYFSIHFPFNFPIFYLKCMPRL